MLLANLVKNAPGRWSKTCAHTKTRGGLILSRCIVYPNLYLLSKAVVYRRRRRCLVVHEGREGKFRLSHVQPVRKETSIPCMNNDTLLILNSLYRRADGRHSYLRIDDASQSHATTPFKIGINAELELFQVGPDKLHFSSSTP